MDYNDNIGEIKVSCLTFHDSANYGSVLQTYALQIAFGKMGIDDYEVINYSNKEKHRNDLPLCRNRQQSLFFYIYKLVETPYLVHKLRKFRLFSKKYIKITKRMHTMEELAKYGKSRDIVVVGSDQVWNAEMIRYDEMYFLKFVPPEKRVAYAASIGISCLNDKEIEFYKNMMGDINLISVRESMGAELIKRITGREVPVVIDPSLILNKEDWKVIAKEKYRQKYIFVYVLEHNPKALVFLNKLKKETGLPVVYVSRGLVSAIREGANKVPSPQEWVSLIMNAEYVVTSSFHGTAFAVNFHRKFFTFIEGDVYEDQNSRQIGFLEMVGLKERINPNVITPDLLDEIDYSFADDVLIRMRKEAFSYLIKVLGINKHE